MGTTYRDRKNPMCPYCHSENDQIDDGDKMDIVDGCDLTCDDCGEEFEVEIRYTTRIKK